jgi:hypothetical protein
MARHLPAQIIDLLLLGAPNRRRQLQDLPILGDVWSWLAEGRKEPPDLLVIPCRGHRTTDVAAILRQPGEEQNRIYGDRSVAYIRQIVVASLTLQDLIEHVIPYTAWWDRIEQDWKKDPPGEATPRDEASLKEWIEAEIHNLFPRPSKDGASGARERAAPDAASQAATRLGALLGTFLGAEVDDKDERETPDWTAYGPDPERIFRSVTEFLGLERIVGLGTDAVTRIFKHYAELNESAKERASIYQVTRNRDAEMALTESVPAIKADAARSLFSISCAELGWAVIDSGINHKHPAFRDQKQVHRIITASGDPNADPDAHPDQDYPHRIRAAFDFTRIRAILGVKDSEVSDLSERISAVTALTKEQCAERLNEIRSDRDQCLPVDWRKVEPLVLLDFSKAQAPTVDHGTHVAGIIGADWQKRNLVTGNFEVRLQGVCPDIGLYDFRVLGCELGDSEFAVTSALQFISYYNQQLGYQRIHGVNMSLAIRHNVRNYACGQTPVCKQAEALVADGIVVVAAAGNRGYLQYQLADQSVYEGYAASSITDPGNADGVITVGATHRSWPHTYGVSFFSSRGPTGDGRSKPDLLAPGERIVSVIGDDRQEAMDGTSMAAPHVSGAAALLMARHEELKGNPNRIKQILCDTATDLKRERQFQGCGMVDVLRAIQSV